MESLQTSKRVLTYLSLHPDNNESNKWIRVARRILPLLFVVVISCAILGCLSFIMKFKSTNMEATLFTAMVALVYVGLIFIMVFAFFARYKLTTMFEGLSEIYETSTDLAPYLINYFTIYKTSINFIEAATIDSTGILARTNDTCELMWLILSRILPCLFIGLSASFCLMTFFNLSHGIYDLDQFYRPYYSKCVSLSLFPISSYKTDIFSNSRFSLPWNQSKIVGYVGELGFIIASCEVALSTNCITIILFISMCLHHCAFYKLFKHTIKEWNCCQQNQCSKTMICHLVRFHISVKTYVSQSHFYFCQMMKLTELLKEIVFIK